MLDLLPREQNSGFFFFFLNEKNKQQTNLNLIKRYICSVAAVYLWVLDFSAAMPWRITGFPWHPGRPLVDPMGFSHLMCIKVSGFDTIPRIFFFSLSYKKFCVKEAFFSESHSLMTFIRIIVLILIWHSRFLKFCFSSRHSNRCVFFTSGCLDQIQ